MANFICVVCLKERLISTKYNMKAKMAKKKFPNIYLFLEFFLNIYLLLELTKNTGQRYISGSEVKRCT